MPAPATTNQRLRAQELHARLNGDVIERARKEGLSLSAWLEREDPSEGYKDGLDAFERQLMLANIVTRSVPHAGIYASKLDAFNKNDVTRALLSEFAVRQWRKASLMSVEERSSLMNSTDYLAGSIQRPYVDSSRIHETQLAPAIPISEVIAYTTTIDGDTYRSMIIEDQPADQRFVRVGEAAEIPATRIKSKTQEVTMYKFGRRLIATYEQLRRQRIDWFARTIARMAIQAEVDKLAAIIDVLVNGDGNSGTAAVNVKAKTDLDANATGKTVTLKAWLLMKLKFKNPYLLTTAISKDTDAYKLLTLNIGSTNIPLVTIAAQAGFGGFTPINQGLADNVRLGWTDDAPTDKIVLFDRRFAIERILEEGSQITEVQRWARDQTQELVMTENEGYAKADPASTMTLELES